MIQEWNELKESYHNSSKIMLAMSDKNQPSKGKCGYKILHVKSQKTVQCFLSVLYSRSLSSSSVVFFLANRPKCVKITTRPSASCTWLIWNTWDACWKQIQRPNPGPGNPNHWKSEFFNKIQSSLGKVGEMAQGVSNSFRKLKLGGPFSPA